MDHQRACVGRALGFDLPDEPQQPRGMVRDPMIRPASEVKLSDLSDFMNTSLPLSVSRMQKENKGKYRMIKQESVKYHYESLYLGLGN